MTLGERSFTLVPATTVQQGTLATARLHLRPFEMRDAADVQRLAGDPDESDQLANSSIRCAPHAASPRISS